MGNPAVYRRMPGRWEPVVIRGIPSIPEIPREHAGSHLVSRGIRREVTDSHGNSRWVSRDTAVGSRGMPWEPMGTHRSPRDPMGTPTGLHEKRNNAGRYDRALPISTRTTRHDHGAQLSRQTTTNSCSCATAVYIYIYCCSAGAGVCCRLPRELRPMIVSGCAC